MKITSSLKQIAGPAGIIQTVLDLPEQITHPGFIAVNCHPHSLHGGSMTNKVTHTASRSIASLGVASMRFNFRGVGASEGVYDEGKGEQQDLIAVVKWMNQQYPESKLILTGFSFGSFVAAMASVELNPELLISIAPPVQRFDFTKFSSPICQWVVIIGDQDELVEYQQVVKWVNGFEPAPQLITLHKASHFFHGQLVELREQIESCVQPILRSYE